LFCAYICTTLPPPKLYHGTAYVGVGCRNTCACQAEAEFLKEIEIMKTVSTPGHRNVVTLLGHCLEMHPFLLVRGPDCSRVGQSNKTC